MSMYHPLLTADQMRRLERGRFAAGQSSLDAMEAAGQAVAAEVLRRWPDARQAVVLAGPGNNGGDGYVVARHLLAAGWTVTVGAWGDPDALRGDAQMMRQRWSGAVAPLAEALAAIDGATIVVDALFGIGFSRPVEGALAGRIREACDRAGGVIAVDVPSGVDADTGSVVSDMIQADATVTFGARKPCHLLEPGRTRCGAVVLAPIDLAPEAAELAQLGVATWAVGTPRLPRPGPDDHKYSRGHVWVASGGPSATGAARLAARAALRVGAGLVSIASPPSAVAINAAHLTAIMVRRAATPEAFAACLADPRASGMVIGPGFGVGERCRETVLALLATGKPLVLDADALTSFEDDPAVLFRAIRGAVVMTPHEGEFRHLFPGIDASAPRLERAREAARISGAVVLLKGPDTVVATPEGEAFINGHASPELATAGAGDVLAGTILGLIAQERQLGLSVAQAAAVAAWIHGEAGLRLGPGLIAEDLPEAYPGILKAIAVPALRGGRQ